MVKWQNKLKENGWAGLRFFKTGLWEKVHAAVDVSTTLPDRSRWYRALETTSFDNVKVVVLGQDVYPTRGHADGLAFSVQPHVQPLPASLRNIFSEYQSDLGFPKPHTGDLSDWAANGVLLLNTILTVEEGRPLSHAGLGWEKLTLEVLTNLNEKKDKLAVLLWGKKAQEYAARFDGKKHLVLKAAHPSPYSANSGFFGCRHFSKAAEYLNTSKDMWKLR